jgi:hypothetical protein
MVTVKSPEARRELARAWPPEFVAYLTEMAKLFGPAEEILVLDERTAEHMKRWRNG